MKKQPLDTSRPRDCASRPSAGRRALRPAMQRELLEVATVEALPSASLEVESEDDPVPGGPIHLRQLRLVL